MGNAALRFFVLLSRLVVGLLFLVSGLIKVNDLTGFTYKLEEYFHVFSARLWEGFAGLLPYSTAIAAGITLLEMALALLLLLGLWRWFTVLLLLILIVFFSLLTGFSAVTNAVTDCGCFGEVLKLTPWQSFGKDIVLTVLILFLYIYREEITPFLKRKPVVRYVAFLGSFLLTAFLTWYCYNHLPLKDFSAYAIGQNLKHNSTTVGPEGNLIAKDYMPWGPDCPVDGKPQDEFSGAVLLVVAYDINTADAEALNAAGQLAQSLKAAGISTMGGTASGADGQKKAAELGATFCWTAQDVTVLKTMVRSSPGFLLLKDGTVVGKWHYNDLPTAAEVLAKLK